MIAGKLFSAWEDKKLKIEILKKRIKTHFVLILLMFSCRHRAADWLRIRF
jgi:hypothetical protein